MKALLAITTVVIGIVAAPVALGQTLAPGGFITENSASQNRVDQPLASAGYRFVTDNSASQNRVGRSLGSPSYRFVTENAASQNRVSQLQTTPIPTTTGFRWADAGIGASAAVGAMLLLLGGMVIALRRRRQFTLAG